MTEDIPDIPDFLLIPQAERNAAWAGRRLTDSRSGLDEDEIAKRQRERNAALAAEEKRKKMESLQTMKDRHPDEQYDPKLKAWVPKKKKQITAAVKPAAPEPKPPSPLSQWYAP